MISFIDSALHLALMALPIRALFIPVGFQSIRIDPNVVFDAIELAKTEKEAEQVVEDLEQKKFYYFNDTSNKEDVSETPEDQEEKEMKDKLLKIIPELKGDSKVHSNTETESKPDISKVIKENDEEEDNRVSILPVKFEVNMRSIITKGIL
jgi:hypothetical protein